MGPVEPRTGRIKSPSRAAPARLYDFYGNTLLASTTETAFTCIALKGYYYDSGSGDTILGSGDTILNY